MSWKAILQMLEVPRLVISNATPIIALSLIGKLDLLQTLYQQVLIPPAVENEVLRGGSKPGAVELDLADYLKTEALQDPRRADLITDLDRGEAEVIALAQEKHADLVLLDERLARRFARRLGIPMTGTVGVLLRAKEQKQIDAIAPFLYDLQSKGIRLSAGLVTQALHLAGEGN